MISQARAPQVTPRGVAIAWSPVINQEQELLLLIKVGACTISSVMLDRTFISMGNVKIKESAIAQLYVSRSNWSCCKVINSVVGCLHHTLLSCIHVLSR